MYTKINTKTVDVRVCATMESEYPSAQVSGMEMHAVTHAVLSLNVCR